MFPTKNPKPTSYKQLLTIMKKMDNGMSTTNIQQARNPSWSTCFHKSEGDSGRFPVSIGACMPLLLDQVQKEEGKERSRNQSQRPTQTDAGEGAISTIELVAQHMRMVY